MSESTLTILDVGHGNSTVLRHDESVVVIDAGPKAGLLHYLVEQDISCIDVLLISHADEDHIGGLVGILSSEEIELRCVRLNTDSLQGSAIWDDLLYELSQSASEGRIDFNPVLTDRDSGTFDQGSVAIEILGPSRYLAGRGPGQRYRGASGPRIHTNSISAVIRILKDGDPIALLPGDLDEVGLSDLIDREVDLSAPVLVFPHHGGSAGQRVDMSTFTASLCQLVKPRTVAFSIGRGDSHERPKPEVVASIRECTSEIHIACTQLSKQCASSLPDGNSPHLNEVFAKGHERCKCCAGTLIIELDTPEKLLPLFLEHRAFITLNAPTALCRQEL